MIRETVKALGVSHADDKFQTAHPGYQHYQCDETRRRGYYHCRAWNDEQPNPADQARQLADALRANGDRYHNRQIDHETFSRVAYGIWHRAESLGIETQVRDDLRERDKLRRRNPPPRKSARLPRGATSQCISVIANHQHIAEPAGETAASYLFRCRGCSDTWRGPKDAAERDRYLRELRENPGFDLAGPIVEVAVGVALIALVVNMLKNNPVGQFFGGIGGAAHAVTTTVGGGFSQLGTTTSQSTPSADNIARAGGADCAITDPMSGMIVGSRC